MSALDRAKERLQRMVKQTPDIIKKEVEKEGEFIADLNREQLSVGQKADGTDMPNYVGNSRAPQAPGKIKLKDTGDYRRGFKTTFDSVSFYIGSTDFKSNFLPRKYPKHLGLTDKSLETLKLEVLDNVIKQVKNIK